MFYALLHTCVKCDACRVIAVLSSFIAGECDTSDGGVVVRNPGRALVAPQRERERLRSLRKRSIQLPELVALLTLHSDVRGPFDYRLTCAVIAPNGQIEGHIQTLSFHWSDGQNIERISVRLEGRIRFFEDGGIYRVRFLFNGEPLCEIPLPIVWEEAGLAVASEEDAKS
jgi:hypothetical protein